MMPDGDREPAGKPVDEEPAGSQLHTGEPELAAGSQRVAGEPIVVEDRAAGSPPVVEPLAIPDDVRARVYAEARRAFPRECCGYLVGARDAGAVDEVVACENRQPPAAGGERGPEDAFAIDGPELFAFARAFDGPRPPRVVYHSHPNGRAYFSSRDRDAARDGWPVQHLVVGVTTAGVTEAALFAWSPAAGDFVELARWSVAP
jgi:proteasome lid subunit RPN8/RPN11